MKHLKNILIVSGLMLIFSCHNEKTEKCIICDKIENAVKASELFKDSELKNFKTYEEVNVKFKELPNYKTIMSDIETCNILLQEANQIKQGVKVENGLIGEISIENIDAYIEIVNNRINASKNQLSILERKCTDKMFKIVFEEHIKNNGKTILITSAHVYLNEKFEVVDFTH